MKKILDSDRLRAVQFRCKHQCNLHIVILYYDWLKDREFSNKIISHKMMMKILCKYFENSFVKWEIMASTEKDLPALSPSELLYVYIIDR